MTTELRSKGPISLAVLALVALAIFSLGVGSGAPRVRAEPAEIDIYVTDWCPYCRRLEAFLKQHDIEYGRYDIEKSDVGQRAYERMGRGGVPIVVIDGEIIRGFQKVEIAKALGLLSIQAD